MESSLPFFEKIKKTNPTEIQIDFLTYDYFMKDRFECQCNWKKNWGKNDITLSINFKRIKMW